MRYLQLFSTMTWLLALGCDIERIPQHAPSKTTAPRATSQPIPPRPPLRATSRPPQTTTRAEDQPTTYEDPLESIQKQRQKQRLPPTPRTSRAIRPVYYERHIPPHPHAKQLCEALHTHPAQRKQACCRERALGYLVTPECIRTLSIALHQKTVILDTSALSACQQAMQQAHQGCAWVGPWPPPTPAFCLGLLRGTRSQGQPCRSSLECKRPLHCRDLGPTQAGRCAPPQTPDTPCGTAPDPLAAYTRQDNTEVDHPVCQGYCRRFRCRSHHLPASPCKADIQCTKGHYCNGQRCIKGQPNTENSPCTGRCTAPLRCVKSRCIRPKPQGAACLSSLECLGACEIPEGQTLGRCTMQCVHPLLRPYKMRLRKPRQQHHKLHPTKPPHKPPSHTTSALSPPQTRRLAHTPPLAHRSPNLLPRRAHNPRRKGALFPTPESRPSASCLHFRSCVHIAFRRKGRRAKAQETAKNGERRTT